MSKDTPDLSSTKGSDPEAAPAVPVAPVAEVAPTSATPDAAAVPAPPAPDAADLVLIDEVALDEVVLAPLAAQMGPRLAAEAVGTFILVLVGVGTALYAMLSGATALGSAFGFGLALVGVTIAFAHVSGGHFNPAVTLGSAIAGRTPWRDVVPYWLAQVIGGALGAGVLFLTVPKTLPAVINSGVATTVRTFFSDTANGYGTHSPLARLTKTVTPAPISFDLLPVLLIEIVATAVFVGVFLAVMHKRRLRTIAPFAIGLTYAVLVLLASPISNGAINPARATATAFFSDGWAFRQLWAFWLAPVLGAALAGLAYRAFATDPLDEDLLDDALLVDESDLVVERIHA